MTSATALLQEGRLAEAVAETTARLRSAPDDRVARTTMAELLCLAGAFDRAEAQLTILAQQTVDRPVAIARTRHLIRAALAREAWFNEAAVPTLVAEPGPAQQAALRLAVAMRAGDDAAIAHWLELAEASRPHMRGSADGVAFDDFRDGDDRCAWFLDILTQDGNYLWVDLTTVERLEFSAVSRPIDLLWREVRMTLRDGRAADVAIPAQYVAPAGASVTEEHRLARRTDWQDGPGGTVLGIGQRLMVLGEDATPILDINEIRFDAP